jgi:hypothetical protein
LFDWSEFTFNDHGLWLNSTQVDQFAVPHTVGVTGDDGTTSTTGTCGTATGRCTPRTTTSWDRSLVRCAPPCIAARSAGRRRSR